MVRSPSRQNTVPAITDLECPMSGGKSYHHTSPSNWIDYVLTLAVRKSFYEASKRTCILQTIFSINFTERDALYLIRLEQLERLRSEITPPHDYPCNRFIPDPFHSNYVLLMLGVTLTTTFVSNLTALALKMDLGMRKRSKWLIRWLCAYLMMYSN